MTGTFQQTIREKIPTLTAEYKFNFDFYRTIPLNH